MLYLYIDYYINNNLVNINIKDIIAEPFQGGGKAKGAYCSGARFERAQNDTNNNRYPILNILHFQVILYGWRKIKNLRCSELCGQKIFLKQSDI